MGALVAGKRGALSDAWHASRCPANLTEGVRKPFVSPLRTNQDTLELVPRAVAPIHVEFLHSTSARGFIAALRLAAMRESKRRGSSN